MSEENPEDKDDSIYEDEIYKDILIKEVQITKNLYNILIDIKTNLKLKKIYETKSSLKNIETIIDQNIIEIETLKQYHRYYDSENQNVLKILNLTKNGIKMFENLAMNKFRKVTDSEIENILEELNLARIDKETSLVGIYDMNISEIKSL